MIFVGVCVCVWVGGGGVEEKKKKYINSFIYIYKYIYVNVYQMIVHLTRWDLFLSFFFVFWKFGKHETWFVLMCVRVYGSCRKLEKYRQRYGKYTRTTNSKGKFLRLTWAKSHRLGKSNKNERAFDRQSGVVFCRWQLLNADIYWFWQ